MGPDLVLSINIHRAHIGEARRVVVHHEDAGHAAPLAAITSVCARKVSGRYVRPQAVAPNLVTQWR